MRMQNKLKVIPLGGLGEIGKNCTIVEYKNEMIMIDCGLTFPDEDMLGVDIEYQILPMLKKIKIS